MNGKGWIAVIRATAVLILPVPLLLVASRPQDERQFVPDHPGKASVAISRGANPNTTAAEREAFNQNLRRFRDLLLAGAMFNPPRGVEITGWVNVASTDLAPSTDRRAPIVGTGFIQFFPYIVDQKTRLPVRFRFTTAEVNVWVNKPDASLEPNLSEGGVRFYVEPERAGEIGGFPVYRRQGGDDILVLSNGGKPPWVPVTREEFVAAWEGIYQKRAARAPVADTLTPKIVNAHKAALAAMSAEERRLPARYFARNPMEPMLAPVGSRLGQALVKANPEWYDPALPRAAIQLISLRFQYAGDLNFEHPETTGNTDVLRVWQMLHTSDWRAISAALAAK